MRRLIPSALQSFRLILPALVFLRVAAAAQGVVEPCQIRVIDKDNGWPVPLVELRTTHHLRFVTDNAGLIALDEPELMNREVWFEIAGHGYGVAKDGFGQRGVRLEPKPGGALTVEVQRTIVAKRLGRLTGAGQFAESQKLGKETDWTESGVFGCDSVQNSMFEGKMFWAWGDTTMPHYPLGIFNMTSATTGLKPLDSFEPPVRLEFDYFTDAKGKPRGVADIPGSGPTWLTAYASLRDENGREHLVATYNKIKPPLSVYKRGLCVWNSEREMFVPFLELALETSDDQPVPAPEGHPIFWTDSDGKEWLMFGDPFPNWRCPASFEAWRNPQTWERLQPQKSLEGAPNGRRIEPHRGSIAWNEFRKRWVAIFTEIRGGPSLLGEIWYVEADTPTGPWGTAVKVISHDDYTFYNPRLHPEFTKPDSPILLFEGTYTMQFSGAKQPSPRCDYNQILYRLDLDDPALRPAQASE